VLLVASRIDALLRAGECAADVNPKAIANFMNFGVSLGPETIIRQIQGIPPGTMLFARESGIRLQQYWDMRSRRRRRARERVGYSVSGSKGWWSGWWPRGFGQMPRAHI